MGAPTSSSPHRSPGWPGLERLVAASLGCIVGALVLRVGLRVLGLGPGSSLALVAPLLAVAWPLARWLPASLTGAWQRQRAVALLYPPPFLLLPRLGLALSDDFFVVRGWWFVVGAALLVPAFRLLAWWLGGRDGLWVGLALLPVWVAMPTLQTLQYGNFHLWAVALAVMGMVLFEQRRFVAGGLLLVALAAAAGRRSGVARGRRPVRPVPIPQGTASPRRVAADTTSS